MLLSAIAAFRLFQNEPCCPEIPFLDALQGVTPGVNALTAPEVGNVLTGRFENYLRYQLIRIMLIPYFIGLLIGPASSTQYLSKVAGGPMMIRIPMVSVYFESCTVSH